MPGTLARFDPNPSQVPVKTVHFTAKRHCDPLSPTPALVKT